MTFRSVLSKTFTLPASWPVLLGVWKIAIPIGLTVWISYPWLISLDLAPGHRSGDAERYVEVKC